MCCWFKDLKLLLNYDTYLWFTFEKKGKNVTTKLDSSFPLYAIQIFNFLFLCMEW